MHFHDITEATRAKQGVGSLGEAHAEQHTQKKRAHTHGFLFNTVPSGYSPSSFGPSDFWLCLCDLACSANARRGGLRLQFAVSTSPPYPPLNSFSFLAPSMHALYQQSFKQQQYILPQSPDNHYKSLLNPHLLDRWGASANIWHCEFVCVCV